MVVAFPSAPIPWNDGITNQPSPAFLAYMTDLQARVTVAEAAIIANNATIGNVFLSSQTVSSATGSIVFTGIVSTYNAYQFHITAMRPSVHNATLWVQMSVDGGATWKNTSNVWSWVYSYITGGTSAFGHNSAAESQAYFRISGATSSTWGNSSEVMLYPNSGQNLNTVTWRSIDYYDDGGGVYQVIGSGNEESDATPCNAVRFFFSSGNIVSGCISMYGIRKT